MFEHRRQVLGVGLDPEAGPTNARASMAAQVVGDHSMTGIHQRLPQRCPGVQEHQRPVGEHQRRTGTGHDHVQPGPIGGLHVMPLSRRQRSSRRQQRCQLRLGSRIHVRPSFQPCPTTVCSRRRPRPQPGVPVHHRTNSRTPPCRSAPFSTTFEAVFGRAVRARLERDLRLDDHATSSVNGSVPSGNVRLHHGRSLLVDQRRGHRGSGRGDRVRGRRHDGAPARSGSVVHHASMGRVDRHRGRPDDVLACPCR